MWWRARTATPKLRVATPGFALEIWGLDDAVADPVAWYLGCFGILSSTWRPSTSNFTEDGASACTFNTRISADPTHPARCPSTSMVPPVAKLHSWVLSILEERQLTGGERTLSSAKQNQHTEACLRCLKRSPASALNATFQALASHHISASVAEGFSVSVEVAALLAMPTSTSAETWGRRKGAGPVPPEEALIDNTRHKREIHPC